MTMKWSWMNVCRGLGPTNFQRPGQGRQPAPPTWLLFFFLIASPLRAADNSITITDMSGQAQTQKPFLISRWFKQGDMSSYPQAIVNGVSVLTQANVKNRWPDGSVKHVMIAFLADVPANGQVNVSFTT